MEKKVEYISDEIEFEENSFYEYDDDINNSYVDCSVDDNIKIYFRDIKNTLLSEEKKKELLIEAKNGNIEARNEFISAHLLYVAKVAKRFQNRGLSYEDLIQEGSIGLFTAFEKYDMNLGYTFLTYADSWIRQAMVRAIQEKSKNIRVPSYQWEKMDKIEAVRKKEYQDWGHSLSYKEISEKVNINEIEVEEIDIINKGMIYLDAPASDQINDNSYEFISTEFDSVEEAVIESELERLVLDVLDNCGSLSNKEREIIKYRYGLYGKPMTQPEIAKIYNVTKQSIQIMEKRAITKLRKSGKVKQLRNFI